MYVYLENKVLSIFFRRETEINNQQCWQQPQYHDQKQRSQDDEKDLGLNPSYAILALDKSVNLFYP